MKKLANVLVACVLAALVITGCSDETNPNGSDDPTPTAPTTSTTPTPTTPAWQSKYTEDQIAAYDAALERWQEYRELSEPIWRAGQDTPDARRIIREYNMAANALIYNLRETYDRGGVRIVVPPKPLSWEPRLIKLNNDGTGSATINQCNDYTNVKVTQRGKPVDGTKPKNVKAILQIQMSKPKGHDWMIATTQLKDRPCAG